MICSPTQAFAPVRSLTLKGSTHRSRHTRCPDFKVKRVSSEPGYQAPTVTVSSSLPRKAVAEAVLVIGVVSDDSSPKVLAAQPHLDEETVAAVESGLQALGATGGEGRTHRLVVASLPVASVLAVGLGKPRDEWPADAIRRAAGTARAPGQGLHRGDVAVRDRSGSRGRGLILGAYRFNDFRSAKTAPTDSGLTAITALVADTTKAAEAEAQRAEDIASAVATARDFVNTPPSHLFPDEFAKRAKALGEAAGLEVEVLDDKALTKAGYGGIVGVGKGSSRPPRLVRLIHRGAGNKKAKRVALVGKGITFDTGGISIKPAANMHHMTSDMGGAAAVIATVVAGRAAESADRGHPRLCRWPRTCRHRPRNDRATCSLNTAVSRWRCSTPTPRAG